MSNDYYSHGILIAPVAIFLAVQRFRNDDSLVYPSGSGNLYGVILLAVALRRLSLLSGRHVPSTWQPLPWSPCWPGWSGRWAARMSCASLPSPLAYLVFMIPLPSWDRITLPLALFTGVCSGGLVQFLGLDVTIVGNAVTLPNADLVIGAQCSGVNSLIALTSLMVLVAYLLDGPVWSRIALVLLSIPLAVIGNILRVATLLFVAREWGAQAAFTYYHDYSGIFFFIGVLLLVYPLDPGAALWPAAL